MYLRPGLLLHRDQSEVTVGARKALLETANRFDFPETMADDGCDGVAHGIPDRVLVDVHAPHYDRTATAAARIARLWPNSVVGE